MVPLCVIHVYPGWTMLSGVSLSRCLTAAIWALFGEVKTPEVAKTAACGTRHPDSEGNNRLDRVCWVALAFELKTRKFTGGLRDLVLLSDPARGHRFKFMLWIYIVNSRPVRTTRHRPHRYPCLYLLYQRSLHKLLLCEHPRGLQNADQCTCQPQK